MDGRPTGGHHCHCQWQIPRLTSAGESMQLNSLNNCFLIKGNEHFLLLQQHMYACTGAHMQFAWRRTGCLLRPCCLSCQSSSRDFTTNALERPCHDFVQVRVGLLKSCYLVMTVTAHQTFHGIFTADLIYQCCSAEELCCHTCGRAVKIIMQFQI